MFLVNIAPNYQDKETIISIQQHFAGLETIRDKVRIQQIRSFCELIILYIHQLFLLVRTIIYTNGLPLARETHYEIRGVSSHLIFMRERDCGKREHRGGEQHGLGGHPENENSS